MPSRSYCVVLTLLVTLLSAAPAWGHARLVTPTPRSSSDGLKTGPCGGVARTANPSQFNVGQQVTVQWVETINHPGYYTVEFSPAGDANFQVLATVNDNQNGAGLHNFSATVTLPMTTCDACTLRLIQYMTEDPNNPSLYYSCADIRLVAAGTPPGGGNNAQSGSSAATAAPKGGQMAGGCGRIASYRDPPGPMGGGLLLVAVLPLLVVSILRRLAPRW